MYSICLHHDAQLDIQELMQTEKEAAATILALLQQIKADPDLLDALSTHNFGKGQSNSDFSVSRWLAQWSRRPMRNLWRIRSTELDRINVPYRIIYAFDPSIRRYHVLGVVHREFNYDPEDQRSKRMFAAYDDLNILSY